MDDNTKDVETEIDSDGFDIKSALSGRDKTIAKLIESEELLKQQLIEATKPSDGGVGEENDDDDNTSGNNNSNHSQDEPPEWAKSFFKNIENKIATIQRSNVDHLMGVDDALSNEEFTTWADGKKTSEYSDETVGMLYATALEKGDMATLSKIMRNFNSEMGISSSESFNHSGNPKKLISGQKKKDLEKAKVLRSKAQDAMKRKDWKSALKLNDEAVALES